MDCVQRNDCCDSVLKYDQNATHARLLNECPSLHRTPNGPALYPAKPAPSCLVLRTGQLHYGSLHGRVHFTTGSCTHFCNLHGTLSVHMILIRGMPVHCMSYIIINQSATAFNTTSGLKKTTAKRNGSPVPRNKQKFPAECLTSENARIAEKARVSIQSHAPVQVNILQLRPEVVRWDALSAAAAGSAYPEVRHGALQASRA